MTGKENGIVQPAGKTYASVTGPPKEKTPPQNRKLKELKDQLSKYLVQQSEGVSLNDARRSCPLLVDHELLNPYPSVRHLLDSMPDVVCMQGLGVQLRLFAPGTPPSS